MLYNSRKIERNKNEKIVNSFTLLNEKDEEGEFRIERVAFDREMKKINETRNVLKQRGTKH